MSRSTANLWYAARAVPVALVLPILGGAGICGNVLVDITQRELILDPVAAVDFAVDSGAVEIYAFDRNGISLFYYMTGSLRVIGDVGYAFNGDTLEVTSVCESDGFCNVNWSAEIMRGTAVDVNSGNGDVKVIGVDEVLRAEVAGGGFEGVGLRAPELEVTVDEGDVDVEMVEAPTRANIAVHAGDVTLTLPQGTYRCVLDTADGKIETTGVTCDETATAVIEVTIESAGDIKLLPGESP